MREYHYKWEVEGIMRSNFKRFEIDIGYRNCLIWMELVRPNRRSMGEGL